MELMEVCSRHEVHFIADEVYALSVYDGTNSQFVSVLTLLPQARQRLLSLFSVTN
jgi:aspartate/methionine/tyrosine aminotransferase